MRTLHLVLKRKWWELIASGEKKEEYRDITDYWVRRLCFSRIDGLCKEPPFKGFDQCYYCQMIAGEDYCAFPFDAVTFHLGYSNTTMTFEIEKISIGKGREEWGADPDKLYFVIKLSKRL